MKEQGKEIHDICCGCCDFKIGEVEDLKDMPKTIVCPRCGVGGMPAELRQFPRTYKRNYPDEYFENQ